MEHYILDAEGNPVLERSMMAWTMWRVANEEAMIVARDELNNCFVSTVFLGINHNWSGGEPILYETMVFDGPLDGEQDRYCTKQEAEEGHKAMVARVVNCKETYA